jgi:outer membrane protein assembly factor BamB
VHVRFRFALTTFDAATGRIRWSIPVPSGSAFGGLDTHEGALVMADFDQVLSLDAASGAERWRRPVDIPFWFPRRRLVHGAVVYLSTLERLYAWDAATGQPRWSIEPRRSDRPMWFHPEPVGAGRLLHVALLPADDHGSAKQYEICAVNVADGALRGAATIEGGGSRGSEIVSSPATDDSVCFGTSAGIYAIGP